ncbi:hypothetical protein [Rufibacter psychrotolerans]|uniref:hypothetical protein n=1 Tax=Rufibacter psychrotolerans TaxID=2812556 RepID=UPI0019685443|nr:hypothetical protein [Rufibacter sp. SYSU D00308]
MLTVFVGLHLFNHLYSVAGAAQHIEVMKGLRLFYRNPLVEAVLLLAVLVQIGSGINLFQKNRKAAVGRFDRLHLWTGLYLAVFFVIHVGAVLVGRTVLHLDTNFYYGVAGLNTFPLNLFFIPYYGLATVSFFGHTAAIHNKKMKRAVLGCSPQSQALAILALGVMVTAFMFYGLTNRFRGVEIPAEYRVLIGK